MMKLNTIQYPDSGKIFVHIDSNNISAILAESKQNSIYNICLNPAFGWREGTSIEFLKENEWIQGISIVGQNCNLTPINYLTNLTYFEGTGTKYTGQLDFFNLPNLEYLIFNWNEKKYCHFEGLTKLKEVRIWKYAGKDLQIFRRMTSLIRIELNYLPKLEDLQGIADLKLLKRLMIYSAPNLKNINALSPLRSLTNLYFELCPKIENFTVLNNLSNIETFVIQKSAPLQSVQFVKTLKKLKYAYIGTEVLDGDVEILKEKKIEYKKIKKKG